MNAPETPLPAEARLPLRLYRWLFLPVLGVLLPGFALRMLRRGRYGERFGERFGRYEPEKRTLLARGGWTWIHAVSVGEMMMALRLARTLREADPGVRILLTTTTSTGDAVAAKALATDGPEAQAQGGALVQSYYPIDFAPVVRRVLDLVRPARVILVDKELWPNLIAGCYERGIPVAIVNARISPRSQRRFLRWRRWVAPFFGMLGRVCVQEEADIAAWAALGVRPEALVHTGSIKFDYTPRPPEAAAALREVLEAVGGGSGPVLLGGSTFPGEEALLVEVFKELRGRYPGLFLILAPRHVERCGEVEEVLRAASLSWVRRSRVKAGAQPVDCLLIDTTGELADWYACASVCFVGKSLSGVATGGQNPAEPLLAGRPVVFGPQMGNFAGLVHPLLAQGGALQVAGREALAAAITSLLDDPEAAQHLVAQGRAVLRVHKGATERVARAV